MSLSLNIQVFIFELVQLKFKSRFKLTNEQHFID